MTMKAMLQMYIDSITNDEDKLEHFKRYTNKDILLFKYALVQPMHVESSNYSNILLDRCT